MPNLVCPKCDKEITEPNHTCPSISRRFFFGLLGAAMVVPSLPKVCDNGHTIVVEELFSTLDILREAGFKSPITSLDLEWDNLNNYYDHVVKPRDIALLEIFEAPPTQIKTYLLPVWKKKDGKLLYSTGRSFKI